MHPLIEAIGKAVHAHPKPCVNISGGIDSTIILHHLTEKTDETIYTYTVGFKGQPTEFLHAQQVADHYRTRHKEILIENMLNTYPQILRFFHAPRFNLWPYWAARQAKRDGRETCYIGEGGDEHFGGYWYKPHDCYVQNWAGLFTFVYPTYQTIYRHFNIRLVAPLHPSNLDWRLTVPFYDEGAEKELLRQAYADVLPDFVLKRRKLNGRKDYWIMWKQELKQAFPEASPKTEEDIRELWNLWVCREWVKARSLSLTNEPCIIAQARHA